MFMFICIVYIYIYLNILCDIYYAKLNWRIYLKLNYNMLNYYLIILEICYEYIVYIINTNKYKIYKYDIFILNIFYNYKQISLRYSNASYLKNIKISNQTLLMFICNIWVTCFK